MATWGDLGNLTHEQMGNFTHGELGRLTKSQIQSFIDDVWPVLEALTPSEREAFRMGVLTQSLPPALLATGESEYTPVEEAALKIWSKQPMSRAEFAAWVAVLLSLVQILQNQINDDPAPAPPPADIVQIHIEQHYHELPDSYKELPKDLHKAEELDAPKGPVTSPPQPVD